MVEQGTHKPLDVGSNPTLATLKTCLGDRFLRLRRFIYRVLSMMRLSGTCWLFVNCR